MPENRSFVEALRPEHADDHLVLAGDVGEVLADVEAALHGLARRFRRVTWVPGNHELWTRPDDPCTLRGVSRYEHLVAFCRERGIATPEDPYSVVQTVDGPVVLAPLFTLFDYSFGHVFAASKADALARAEAAGVVCTDEHVLHPDPFATIDGWSADRVRRTRARLDEAVVDGRPTVLINHWPLVRAPTEVLRHPHFAIWCGTEATADWHRRYRARVVVYGHLHIPRRTIYDGVPFEEVSLGYAREWRHRQGTPGARRLLDLAA